MTGRLPAALAAALLSATAHAGTHVGNLTLRTHDDATPLVTMDPTTAPRLAFWTCGNNTPTILTGTVGTNETVFALDSDLGTLCKVGIDLGSPVTLRVANVATATVEPVPEAFDVTPIHVTDLAGAILRAGTSTMMSNLRAIAAVPRTATSSEEEAIAAHLSVLTLHLP